MSLEVTQILLDAQSVDGIVRKHVEENLRQFQDHNLSAFLISLCGELANNEKCVESRKLEGLVLKNTLDAKEPLRKAELVKRWISLDGAVKNQIKGFLLQTLSSPVRDARPTSAQVIVKIAGIELPQGQWPELMRTLLLNMGGPQMEPPAHLKQAILETLGYLCEQVVADSLAQDHVNSILTAVVHGMNLTKINNEVRLFIFQINRIRYGIMRIVGEIAIQIW